MYRVATSNTIQNLCNMEHLAIVISLGVLVSISNVDTIEEVMSEGHSKDVALIKYRMGESW